MFKLNFPSVRRHFRTFWSISCSSSSHCALQISHALYEYRYIFKKLYIFDTPFQVPRLRLSRYPSDDCQLFPSRTDGGSLETPTFDSPPGDPHLSSGSLDRMCRQTCATVTFRLITWCAVSHTGKVISTSSILANFYTICRDPYLKTLCQRQVKDIL